MLKNQFFSDAPSKNESYVIIGMGLSGIALFCQLVDKLIELDKTANIICFEKNQNNMAAGEPYRADCPLIWTLNNPASELKLTTNGINMAGWMKENPSKWRNDFSDIDQDYVPRALVGRYLYDQYVTYKNKAILHGINVKECYEEVIDINQNESGGWYLQSNIGNRYQAQCIFLCFGHLPTNHYNHLQEKPNFYSAAEGIDKLKQIPQHADVYIIGGQATFVDMAIWLAYVKQHTGKIHTLTRNPPTITSKGNKEQFDKNSVETLHNHLKTNYAANSLSFSTGKQLFWNTYKQNSKNPIDVDNQPNSKAALFYQLAKFTGESNIDNTIGNIDELRAFVATFYFSGCYCEFWQKLRDEDKEEFMAHFYSKIFAYLTGITPLNARLLLELYNREQIQEQAGLLGINYDDHKQLFILKFKNNETKEAQFVIDASGLGLRINNDIAIPLINNLVAKGILTPKSFGGININAFGQVINRNNEPLQNIFCIGPLASYGAKCPTHYSASFAAKAIESSLEVLGNVINNENNNKLFYSARC